MKLRDLIHKRSRSQVTTPEGAQGAKSKAQVTEERPMKDVIYLVRREGTNDKVRVHVRKYADG